MTPEQAEAILILGTVGVAFVLGHRIGYTKAQLEKREETK